MKEGECSLCLQLILYTIDVIKLFRKNEKLIKKVVRISKVDLLLPIMNKTYGSQKNCIVQNRQ